MNKGKKMDKQKVIANSAFWLIVIVLAGCFYIADYLANPWKEVPIWRCSESKWGQKLSRLRSSNDVRVTPKGENKPTERSVKEAGTWSTSRVLEQGKTKVQVTPIDNSGDIFWNLAIILIPTLGVAALVFMMRSAQGQNNQAMSWQIEKLNYTAKIKENSFWWHRGQWNAKQDLYEVVDFFEKSQKISEDGR